MGRRTLLAGLILLASCAGAERAGRAFLAPENERALAAADSLERRGCYVRLKEAFGIYSALYALPDCRDLVAARLVKNALLLAVREKELGMSGRAYLDKALGVIEENAGLREFNPYVEIAGLLWIQGKGVMPNVDERFPWKETEEKLRRLDAELKERARVDEFSAYMYGSLKCLVASPSEEGEGPSELAALFPDSAMLAYLEATCPREDAESLTLILSREPEFYEASYHLGMISLSRGALLQAEGHLLRMREGIPGSPQTTLLLATIAFALEEVERSLDLYEKTLDLLPDYRDALLGKAVCLSSLGRADEAITVCEKIIALGHWMLGESYYWMAWNQHELKDETAAAESIEQSKGRLPTSSEVYTLSGLIAMERGDQDRAEKDFREALRYKPDNADVFYNLANLLARREDWAGSGQTFEKAAFAFEKEGRVLREKIAQVEASTLAPQRKERLVRKRTARLEKAILSRATAFYNAAAGYFNAGQRYKALELAARSAEHPALREKAEGLMSDIK